MSGVERDARESQACERELIPRWKEAIDDRRDGQALPAAGADFRHRLALLQATIRRDIPIIGLWADAHGDWTRATDRLI